MIPTGLAWCEATSEQCGQPPLSPAATAQAPKARGKLPGNRRKQKTASQGAELGLTILPVTAPGRVSVPADAIQPRRADSAGLLAGVPPLTRARVGVLFFF